MRLKSLASALDYLVSNVRGFTPMRSRMRRRDRRGGESIEVCRARLRWHSFSASVSPFARRIQHDLFLRRNNDEDAMTPTKAVAGEGIAAAMRKPPPDKKGIPREIAPIASQSINPELSPELEPIM